MTPEKEKELLTALSKGNQSAFDSLYLFYAPKVREFVFRLLKNPGEAEDVTQNIFLRVWEKRRELGGTRSLRSYLYTDNLENFIARVEKGLNEKTSLLYMNQVYQQGNMSNLELMEYKNALSEADNDKEAARVYQELLNRLTEQEKTQKEYWSLYTDGSCTIGSPMFDFLLAHLPAIRKNVGENTVDRFIYKHYAKALQDHIIGYAKEDAIPVETLKKQIHGFQIKGQENLEKMLALAEPVSNKDIDKVAAIVKEKIPQTGAEELKLYAFAFRAILWTTPTPHPKHYQQVGKKLVKQTIANMEKKEDKLSSNDLVTYSIILMCMGENTLEKKDYIRLIALGEKVLPNLPDDDEKSHAQWTFDGYKKHVESNRK